MGIALAIAAGLGACGESNPPGYRYKLTLNVETPDGIKRGHNVVDVRFVKRNFPEKHTNIVLTGEAVYVDLGPGLRPLIALLAARDRPTDRPAQAREGWDSYGTPGAVIGRAFRGEPELKKDKIEGGIEVLAGRGPREITPADLPDLVTFADVNDPKTVLAVDPNDLEGTLGPGVKWHRITLEITDEPVTTGLERRLPWTATLRDGYYLDGSTSSRRLNLANSLQITDFKRWGF